MMNQTITCFYQDVYLSAALNLFLLIRSCHQLPTELSSTSQMHNAHDTNLDVKLALANDLYIISIVSHHTDASNTLENPLLDILSHNNVDNVSINIQSSWWSHLHPLAQLAVIKSWMYQHDKTLLWAPLPLR